MKKNCVLKQNSGLNLAVLICLRKINAIGLIQVRSRSEPSMNFISIEVLGGGQISDYDRKLLGTLGVKKNHISNGFSGGNGAT